MTLSCTSAARASCFVWRPNGSQLQNVDEQDWARAFPRSPRQCGLQLQWVESRMSAVNLDSMVPAVPDWGQLGETQYEGDYAST